LGWWWGVTLIYQIPFKVHCPVGWVFARNCPMYNHWAVRTSTPLEPFNEFKTCQWTWNRLTSLFPDMLGAMIMPNHIHLIVPVVPGVGQEHSKQVLHKLHGLTGALSKRTKIIHLWQKIAPPHPIPDIFHLRRHVRYVALNPCRRSLCADPLEWQWSTYRDLFGASAFPILSERRLAQVVKDPRPKFTVRFHAYVSGDPSVKVQGTSSPKLLDLEYLSRKSLDDILDASASALRLPPSDVKESGPLRDLFIHFAYRHGWKGQTARIAKICGVTPRSVQRILGKPTPIGISATTVCLSDPRFRWVRVVKNSVGRWE